MLSTNDRSLRPEPLLTLSSSTQLPRVHLQATAYRRTFPLRPSSWRSQGMLTLNPSPSRTQCKLLPDSIGPFLLLRNCGFFSTPGHGSHPIPTPRQPNTTSLLVAGRWLSTGIHWWETNAPSPIISPEMIGQPKVKTLSREVHGYLVRVVIHFINEQTDATIASI